MKVKVYCFRVEFDRISFIFPPGMSNHLSYPYLDPRLNPEGEGRRDSRRRITTERGREEERE